MSLGKKIVTLLITLFILIIYTLSTFDYDSYLTKNNKETNIEFNVEFIRDFAQNLKTKAIDIKDELIKKIGLDEESTTNDVVVNEIKENESTVIENDDEKKDLIQEEIEKLTEEEIVDSEIIENQETDITDNQEDNIETEEINKPIEETIVVYTQEQIQTIINDILKENKIIFKRRSVDITKESFSSVEKVATILKEHDSYQIEIAGHTDSRGKASLNKRISQDRANSVKKALVELGVSHERLTAVGYGEKYPIAKDDKNGLSEINRRVEINIIGDKK